MLKSELLVAIQREIQSHDFSHFVDDPPSIAQGGKGIVVPGCPKCRVRINTTSKFLDHLANDAMPALFARLSSQLSTAAKLSVAIFVLLLLGSPSISTTVVMLLLKDGRIVVAADGRQTEIKESGRSEHRDICKIHPVNDVQISVIGMAQYLPTGFNPEADATTVFSRQEGFLERVEKLDRLLVPEIQDVMRNIQLTTPDEYRGYLPPSKANPQKPILETLVVSTSGVVFAVLHYDLRLDGSIENKVQIFSHDAHGGIVVFGEKALITQEEQKSEFEAMITADPIKAAKHLVEIEYGEEVGPPIAITEISNNKVKWIARGACQEN